MPGSPVPDGVGRELRRVVRRWQQLPLDHALVRLPAVRAVIEDLAGSPVPDLGPAVVMDQLTVVVHDACVADPALDLTPTLVELRRALAG